MTGQRGLFVSIDGPGGSGKSTVAALVTAHLARRGLAVRQTREPSPTPLGQLIRASTDEYAGMALACLVAGDRHHHLAAEIGPDWPPGRSSSATATFPPAWSCSAWTASAGTSSSS